MALKVFLVEDSAALRAHLTDILITEAKVIIVGLAETEAQAKDWLERNPDNWDIALVDLFLHEGTGAGVVQQVRNRRPNQTVFVMTNHISDDALLHSCKLMGADAVYHKGTELDDMVANCIGLATRKSVPY